MNIYNKHVTQTSQHVRQQNTQMLQQFNMMTELMANDGVVYA